MMEFLTQYSLFALETFTLVVAILLLTVGLLSISHKPKSTMVITSLNKNRNEVQSRIYKEVLGKKLDKPKKDKLKKPTLFVLDFSGDIKASQVEQLRQEITAVLLIATKEDEVLVRLESPGGSVNGYGLAAAQLQRIRDKRIPLTVCIDKVAASGGYLMACVANKILAAPFAIIGSIGVVAQIPNFHRLLKKNDIEVEMLTSGEFKRTLTMFAENTKIGRQKFQEDIEVIHQRFKDYVLMYREHLDIERIATGEHWLARDALNLKLVDELKTSDDYLSDKLASFNAFKIKIQGKQSLADKLLKPAMKLVHPWA